MIGLTRLAVAIGLAHLIVFGIVTLFKKLGAPSLDAAGHQEWKPCWRGRASRA
jgi:hypothetical protein